MKVIHNHPVSFTRFLTLLVAVVTMLAVSSFSPAFAETKSAKLKQQKEQKVEFIQAQKAAKKANKSKLVKRVKSSKFSCVKDKQYVVGLAKRFRKLNRQLVKAEPKKASYELKNVFVTSFSTHGSPYKVLENKIDTFASNDDAQEGKGKCMKECADSFPGTGGGQGVNRVACKLSCLVLGE